MTVWHVITDGAHVIDRRHFLKTLGLSGSAALLDSCAPAPSEKLIPYLIAPDEVTPGIPAYYATTCRACPAGCGMLAKAIDGRVIKVEGNPGHPISRGHLCVRGQAAVQSLYSPDRFGMPRARDDHGVARQISWDEAETLLARRLRAAKQRGSNRVAWLGGLATGSFDELTAAWLGALGSDRRLLYEAFDHEPLRAAGQLAFGRREIPRYDFGRAQFVLSFGADFLETWISNVEFMAGYADVRRRRIRETAGSFAWIAPRRSLTGLNSDAWIAPRPGSEALVALAIADAMVEQGLTHPSAAGHLPWIAGAVSAYAADRVKSVTDVEPAAIREVAQTFATSLPSVAVGGGISGAGERHAIELELAVLILNVLAGNVGNTVTYGAGSAFDRLATRADLIDLTRAMADGEIDVLLVHGTNPALTLPSAVGFVEAMRHVPFVVTFSNTPDETSDHAHLILPDHHFLESWGDHVPRGGIVNLQQPAAAPRLHSRATGDVLMEVARQVDDETARAFGQRTWLEYVRGRWIERRPARADASDDGELGWLSDVRAGGRLEPTAPAVVSLRDVSSLLGRITPDPAPPADVFTLVAYPSAHFYDGRDANEPWLREVPDPVTKIVWRGWIELHPDAARRLGVSEGDAVDVESPHGRLQASAHVTRDLRADTIAMPIGFGRSSALRYAAGRGANPAALLAARARDGAHAAWRVEQVRLRRAAGQRRIIALQPAAENPSQAFAGIVSPARVDVRAQAPRLSTGMYPAHSHPEHRWGMAIDLNTCTGCNACVVACYAENNVPTVGEEMCAKGREMSWIRVERYRGAFLPMLCQQCDEAPCESVCPVTATYHNPEGLNAQIYNRCIGTRFCSNNCPYKVRRFNFQQPQWPSPLDEQLNPDVTVRSAGVMEKCTFCVQRIQAGKNQAKREGRALRDGDITPACAQTCPAEAIVFGDLHDPNSRVSRLANEARGYHVLEELNTHPAITYLRRSTPAPIDEAG